MKLLLIYIDRSSVVLAEGTKEECQSKAVTFVEDVLKDTRLQLGEYGSETGIFYKSDMSIKQLFCSLKFVD